MRTNWKHKRIFEFACISATETIPTWKKIWSVNLIQLLLNNKVKSNEFFSEKIDLIFIHIKLWTTLYFRQRWNLKWKLILNQHWKRRSYELIFPGIKEAIRMNFIKCYSNKNVIEREHTLFEVYFLRWNIFDFSVLFSFQLISKLEISENQWNGLFFVFLSMQNWYLVFEWNKRCFLSSYALME